MKAFTLIELLLAVAILGVISLLSVPLGIDFYYSHQLDSGAQGVIQALRQAQSRAMAGEGESAFGVAFFEGSYVIFRGSSYVARNTAYDETYSFSSAIEYSGPAEIVFSKLYSDTSDCILVLTFGKRTKTISVTESIVSFSLPKEEPMESCLGTVLSCSVSNFPDSASCFGQEGCSWIPFDCSGICVACSSFVEQSLCLAQSGCSWHPVKGCQGTCLACNNTNFPAYSLCVAQSGCVGIQEDCAGTAVSCDSYSSQAECESQSGCYFE